MVDKRYGSAVVKDENKSIKLFVMEAIGLLIESVGNRKEEERILRSFLVHYDGYFNGKITSAA